MGKGSLKNVNHALVHTADRPLLTSKLLRLMKRRIGPPIQICAHSELHVARYYGCTKARCMSKGSYGEGELKNVNLALVQTAHRPRVTGEQTIPFNAALHVYGRQYNSAHFRSYMSPGTMVTPKQGAYEKEAMGRRA